MPSKTRKKKPTKKTTTKKHKGGTMFISKATHTKQMKEAEETILKLKETLQAKLNELNEYKNKVDKEYSDQKAIAYKTMDLEFKDKLMSQTNKLKEAHSEELQKVREEFDKKLMTLNEEHFEKLKTSLQKLHEEGNATTKYVENLSLKMMETFKPTNIKQISVQD